MTVFLITAPSGAGKTTFVKHLEKNSWWEECISHTTRRMREGEVDGTTYFYVNVDTFLGMANKGEFAEKVMYNHNHYGITKEEIKRVTDKGNHAAIIVEHDGYKQVKALYPDAVGIFLYAKKEECMINMLSRGDKLVDALERIQKYDEEIKNRDEYDYVIKNVLGKQTSVQQILRGIVSQYD